MSIESEVITVKFATDTILELEGEAEDALHFIQSGGATQSSDTRVVLLTEAKWHLERCLAMLDEVEPSLRVEGGEFNAA